MNTMDTNTRAPLPVEHNDRGFAMVMGSARGYPEATMDWYKASRAILFAAPETTPEGVRFFLESPYGEKVAQSVLDGQSVETQMEFRLARFRKHYEQTERNRTSRKK
jgi:hypothetical protein